MLSRIDNRGYLNEQIASLPEVLQGNGYHTMMSGKWCVERQENYTD